MEKVFHHGECLYISDLCKEDYHSNYLNLLTQLTTINPELITSSDFSSFVERLHKGHIIKVIRNETNLIVGSVTILIEDKLIHNFGKVGHIEDVVIEKTMRGKGVGKLLIKVAEKECVECYKIILDCSDENVGFYEKCGYKKNGNQMSLYR